MAEPVSFVIISPQFTNQLVTFIIPFIIFFAILLWIIKKTKFFGDNNFIYVILALGLVILIRVYNPNKVFETLGGYLFQIGVVGSIVALLVASMLVFFPIMKAIAKMTESPAQKISRLQKEQSKLYNKFYRTWNPQKRMVYAEQLKSKKNEIDYLMSKYKKL